MVSISGLINPLSGHSIRDAIDIIPSACIVPYKMFSQGRSNFHELISSLHLLYQYIDFNGPNWYMKMLLKSGKHFIPQGGFLRSLNFWQVQNNRRTCLQQCLIIIYYVKRQVYYRGCYRFSMYIRDVTIIQVQATSAKYSGCKIELLRPIDNNLSA